MLVELKCGLLKTARYIFYNFSGLNFLQPLTVTQFSSQVCLFFFAYISSPYNTTFTFKYNVIFNFFIYSIFFYSATPLWTRTMCLHQSNYRAKNSLQDTINYAK